MPHPIFVLLYALPLVLMVWLYLRRRQSRETQATAVLEKSVRSGLTEPPSLHPVFDPAICVGGGSCALACPEKAVGIINGKGALVNPTLCIGHGACAASCPVEAITLVFGTARRGIEIPYVRPNFETNVPGIFIAGELGGMGLVRKAAQQGSQAMDSIRQRRGRGEMLDVVVVCAGPAGLSATLGAMAHGLRFATLEQETSLGGTVYHYPRNKIVMTQPVTLPMVGKVKLGEISKESLLAFWQGIVDQVRMPIQFGERLEKIVKDNDAYLVVTTRSSYRTRSVLLAIGRRGTPRKLEVPGEEQPKVVYRLVDPEQYRGQKILVVGGGDSAIEAAVALASEPDTTVTLSYRGEAFGRVKPANRERLEQASSGGRLRLALGTTVGRIEQKFVHLTKGDETVTLDNDVVIVCAGGVLPIPMLKDIGIAVETKFGTA
jgi:thioredoxin reductase (NADPH)